MMPITFARDGWVGTSHDETGDLATVTRLRISVGEAVLTRHFNKRGGGESEAIAVPLLPLSLFIARSWWPLLNEPIRPSAHTRFQARHRLDVHLHGYIFPALAICSAGDDAITLDWGVEDFEFSPIHFLTQAPAEPIQLARSIVESALMDIVETTLERLPSTSPGYEELADDWGRVVSSFESVDELRYCRTAGRLGMDPYDEDSPDLQRFAEELSLPLLDDVSEAIEVVELEATAQWAKQAASHLENCPSVEVGAFGSAPADDLKFPAWMTGSLAARAVTNALGLNLLRPRKLVEEILGSAVSQKSAIASKGTGTIVSLLNRSNGRAKIGAVAQTARQQRFRACSAVYLAWLAESGQSRAGTIAYTRKQQASRAFAAELLAPQSLLLERAGPHGFTEEAIEAIASDFICPQEAVIRQSIRAGIPLRGVEIPHARRASLM